MSYIELQIIKEPAKMAQDVSSLRTKKKPEYDVAFSETYLKQTMICLVIKLALQNLIGTAQHMRWRISL